MVYAGGRDGGILALDAVSGVRIDYPLVGGPGVTYPYVYELAVSDGTVYVGGLFGSIGEQPHSNFAAVSAVPTATLLARFEATAIADGIELRWMFGEANRVTAVTVERAPSAAGPWSPIAPELHDEFGTTVALDRTANGDGEYFYRLVAQLTGGGQATFGPVSASQRGPIVRSDVTLVAPNPTPGGAQVRYEVARAGRVRLELLDVSGRVVETLADRVLEPGRYEAAWDGTGRHGRVAPRLYFLRYTVPDGTTVRKLAVVR